MISKVIEVDFLKKEPDKEKESSHSDDADSVSDETVETKEQKLLRLAGAIEKGTYSPNLEDVAEAILTDILLDDSAKNDD